MGYTTDFSGQFHFNKPLGEKIKAYLTLLNETRRMKRNVDEAFGVEGEFYAFGGGSYGQDHEDNIVDHNTPPSTQPSLWLQWTPTEDGAGLEWDGGEKFYCYTEWLVYLINKILAPNGYVLNGVVDYQGEEFSDRGEIEVKDNVVYLDGKEVKAQIVDYRGQVTSMRTDVVLLLEEDGKPLQQALLQ